MNKTTLSKAAPKSTFRFTGSPRTGNTAPAIPAPEPAFPLGVEPFVHLAESDLAGMSILDCDLATEFLPEPNRFFYPTPRKIVESIFRLAGKGRFDLLSIAAELEERGELRALCQSGYWGDAALVELIAPAGRAADLVPDREHAAECRRLIERAHATRSRTTVDTGAAVEKLGAGIAAIVAELEELS